MYEPKRRKPNEDRDQSYFNGYSYQDEHEDELRRSRNSCRNSPKRKNVPPPLEPIQEQEDCDRSSINRAFRMDETVARISSFCDFDTNATALRLVTKKMNESVNRQLFHMSTSALPFECQENDMFISNEGLSAEVNARIYLHKNNVSPEFKCRTSFFSNIKDSIHDEFLEVVSECDVEHQGSFKKAFGELLTTNGTVKLSDFDPLQSPEEERTMRETVLLLPQLFQHRQPEVEAANVVHVIEDEKKMDCTDSNSTYEEDPRGIRYHHKQAVDQKKDWKLTFVQKPITLQESFQQLETYSNETTKKTMQESLDEVNTAPLLSIFDDLPFPMENIQLAELKQCLFGLLLNANPSSINYYRLSMNDRHVEGYAERGLKGALTFLTQDNDEIEFGVEVWLQFDSPP